MEIRFIQDEEIANAAGLSRFVFDTCLRMRMDFSQTTTFVEDYLTESNLRAKKQEGQLLLWGVYEEGQLVGTGGMQPNGVITMLYILPQYFKKKYGTNLLNTMRLYAKEILGLSQVTVNATPSFTSYYFEKNGFKTTKPRSGMQVPFVHMYASSDRTQCYKKRPVPAGVIIGAVVGCVIFATLVGCIFMCWYLF